VEGTRYRIGNCSIPHHRPARPWSPGAVAVVELLFVAAVAAAVAGSAAVGVTSVLVPVSSPRSIGAWRWSKTVVEVK